MFPNIFSFEYKWQCLLSHSISFMRIGFVDNQTATSCQGRTVLSWYGTMMVVGAISHVTTSSPIPARKALVSTSPSTGVLVTSGVQASALFGFALAAFCGQPPLVLHAKMFGQRQLRYRTSSQVRYHCGAGFIQRQNPVITCQNNGQWEEPQITCTPGERSKTNVV